MRAVLLFLVGGMAMSCGPDLRTFDVTIRTVRRCHPAGIIPQLCDDPSEFAGRTRTARYVLEERGPTQFILYDETGRALPGVIQRGYYFARAESSTVESGGCAKTVERSARFDVLTDPVPDIPRLHEHRRARIRGTVQDRASQSVECGQATQSKQEDEFVGDETTEYAWENLPGAP